MTAWYNEPDPFAANTLRNLIAAGHIAPGVVDTRDIREVEAYELAEFTQCHWFAGCGVWSYALRRAGWRDDEPIWSGSCPCPPFSQAGPGQTCPRCGSRHNICHPRKTGHFVCLSCGCDRLADDRHLYPEFARIIRDGKPSIVIGEQVASSDGRIWLAAVSADMETMGYAVAGADLCSAGFDGAHIRQRNYFVGLADDDERPGTQGCSLGRGSGDRSHALERPGPGSGRFFERLANNNNNPRSQGWGECWDGADECFARPLGLAGGLEHSNGGQSSTKSGNAGEMCGLSETQREPEHGAALSLRGSGISATDAPMLGRTPVDWLYCRDGKWRAVEPGTFPLVDAAPARVGRLRMYGNALDAETATEFCRVVREIVQGI